MRPLRILLIGRDFSDSMLLFFKLGAVAKAHPCGRIRAVHSGSVAAVLWACGVDKELIAATASVPNITLHSFLTAVLPHNAAALCEKKQVTILTQFGNEMFTKVPERHIRWNSKSSLISCVVASCRPLHMVWPRVGTAAYSTLIERLACTSEVLQPHNLKPFECVTPSPQDSLNDASSVC